MCLVSPYTEEQSHFFLDVYAYEVYICPWIIIVFLVQVVANERSNNEPHVKFQSWIIW